MAKEGEYIPRNQRRPDPPSIKDLIAKRDFGELPHEFLLRVTRGERIQHGEDEDGVPKFIQPTFDERLDAAKFAAPFYAPKLTSVELMRGASDHELDSIIAELASEAGVILSAPGEGTPGEDPEPEATDIHSNRTGRSRSRVVLSDDARASVPRPESS